MKNSAHNNKDTLNQRKVRKKKGTMRDEDWEIEVKGKRERERETKSGEKGIGVVKKERRATPDERGNK